MLILKRHQEQAVYINESIRVVFLGMENGQARIGFIGPDDVSFRREEVPLNKFRRGDHQRKQRKTREQSSVLPPPVEGPASYGFVFHT